MAFAAPHAAEAHADAIAEAERAGRIEDALHLTRDTQQIVLRLRQLA